MGKKPSLAIVEEEAELVRLVFRRYVDGTGPTEIARELRSLGAVSRRGAPWSRSAVRYLLTNPVYVGQILFRRQGQAVTAAGLHPPIVSRELWDAAEQRREGRRKGQRKTGPAAHALTGIFRCARCGRRMQVSGRGADGRLYCPARGCVPSVKAETVERALLPALRPLLEHSPSGGKHLAEQRRTAQDTDRRELARLDAALLRLCDLLERGIYDEETFLRRREDLDRQRADLLARRTECIPAGPQAATAWEQYGRSCEAVKQALLREILADAAYDRTPAGRIRLSLRDSRGGVRCVVLR